MRQVYPDEGLVRMCRLVADNADEGMLWALFTNDVDPDQNTKRADLLLAGAWGQVTLKSVDFVMDQVVNHIGTIQGATRELTNTTGGSVVVYGWCTVDEQRSKLIMAARYDDAPITVPNGGTIGITPILGDYSDANVPIIDGGTF